MKREKLTEPTRLVRTGGNNPQEGEALSVTPELGDALESWKEIAAFIGRDLRTAIRWEKEKGMPIRRGPGGKGSRVYGSKREIAEWLRGNQEPELDQGAAAGVTEPSLKFRVVLIVALVTAILAFGAIVTLARRPFSRSILTRVHFGESSVEALDEQGRHMWIYAFGRRLEPSVVANRPGGLDYFVRIADLRSDEGREVVFIAPFRMGSNPNDAPQIEVVCLSGSGKLLWSYVSHEAFRFGDHDLRGPWYPEYILTSNAPDHAVWAAFSHADWGDAYVTRLDPLTGRSSIRYVNTGTIRFLGELRTAQTTYLLVGGFNNEHDGPSLAVVDERKPFAASPQTDGTRHKCVSCPEGSPDYYFVFPRSEINRIKKVYEDSAWGVVSVDGGLTASVLDLQKLSNEVRTLYQFAVDPAIRPVSVQFSSTYVIMHRDLERAHQIDHTLGNCPERLHPLPVRMWTPGGGWTEIRLKAVD